jgi:hypothetical protein
MSVADRHWPTQKRLPTHLGIHPICSAGCAIASDKNVLLAFAFEPHHGRNSRRGAIAAVAKPENALAMDARYCPFESGRPHLLFDNFGSDRDPVKFVKSIDFWSCNYHCFTDGLTASRGNSALPYPFFSNGTAFSLRTWTHNVDSLPRCKLCAHRTLGMPT